MKQIVSRIALAALVLATAVPSFAATEDTMILRGKVAQILEVDLEPTALASNLDLTQSADSLDVAKVFERSNDPDGYVITFRSENEGVLKGSQPSNEDVMPYSLNYAGEGNFSLSSGPKEFSHAGRTGVEGVVRSLSVSYPEKWLAADTYEDTVTVTIAAL